MFSQEWHAALVEITTGQDAPQLGAVTEVLKELGTLGTLREPHIELVEGEVRFTWNRDGHYIEVSINAAAGVEWFYSRPDRTSEGNDGLDDRFRVVMEHARSRV